MPKTTEKPKKESDVTSQRDPQDLLREEKWLDDIFKSLAE